MIKGVGVDIVEIKRLEDAVGRWGRRFLDRVFTEQEIAYCMARSRPASSFAVRFAAKEAVMKAVGGGVTFREIEIANRAGKQEAGPPEVVRAGKLEKALAASGIKNIHLSLSHEREFGVAFVVAEGG